jgi:predicted ATPase
VKTAGNVFRLPELLRLKGIILSSRRSPDPDSGEEYLLEALQLAGRQSALAWQLRTASDTARLWLAKKRSMDAHNVLAPVYGRFTEGFQRPDLIEARGLLERIEQSIISTPS